jgi:probable HAF family extracellular repeat protein
MASIHSTGACRRVMVAISTAVVFFALAVASALPTWAQALSAASPAEVRPRLHGYLLDDGEFTVIDAPDAILGTGALGINTRGQIVGQYGAADGRIHGFLLDDGVFTTIDAPGAINTNASNINDRGQIVGFYLEPNEGE